MQKLAEERTDFDIDLDLETFSRLPFFPRNQPLNPNAAVIVLMSIVTTDPRLEKEYQKPEEAEPLLEHHGDLKNKIIEGWERGTFADVRRFPLLKNRQIARFPVNVNHNRQAAESAWEGDYKGDKHLLTMQTISEMNCTRGTKKYANFVSIIQSSGTGKSRMLDEMAKRVFALPFNLHQEDETSAIPPPDVGVRDTLGRIARYEALRARYLRFLSALFKAAAAEIEQLELEPMTSEDLARIWHTHLQEDDPSSSRSNRTRLYDEAIAKSTAPSSSVYDIDHLAQVALTAANTLKATLNSLTKTDCTSGLRILLGFNTHCLTDAKASGEGETRDLFDALCCTLNDLRGCPGLFTIFLSANPRLLRYPPAPVAPDILLQPPITEMPFDCWPKGSGKLVNPHKLSLGCVSKAEFMVSFGRPLFWAQWNAGNAIVRNGITNFAMNKLARWETNPRDLHLIQLDPLSQLAVLSTRLSLEFQPCRTFAEIEERLIEDHLRMTYSVSGHGNHLLSGTSSEPILAEAAAQLMNSDPSLKGPAAAVRLAFFARIGLISDGKQTELVAQLLLTLAHDSAIEALHPERVWYSTAIPVTLFLNCLFNKERHPDILGCRPEGNLGGDVLSTAFKDASVRFTHFVKTSDAVDVSTASAFAGISRGYAIQRSEIQSDINIMIPVALNGEKLCEETMTAILISIRTGVSSQSKVDQAALKFFPPPDLEHKAESLVDARPYIVIIMELGIHSEGGSPQPSVYLLPPLNQSNQHPCYRISIPGGSTPEFSCLDNDKISELLTCRSVLTEQTGHNQREIQSLDM